jgi:hypothetical protein
VTASAVCSGEDVIGSAACHIISLPDSFSDLDAAHPSGTAHLLAAAHRAPSTVGVALADDHLTTHHL